MTAQEDTTSSKPPTEWITLPLVDEESSTMSSIITAAQLTTELTRKDNKRLTEDSSYNKLVVTSHRNQSDQVSLQMQSQSVQDSPRPPPTAKVAPLVGTPHRSLGHFTQQELTTPTSSSKTRHRREKEGFLSESSPCLSSAMFEHRLRDGLSPIKEGHNDKIRNLMSLLTEKNQIIDRQKNTISRLQSECKEKDAQLRTLTLTSVRSYPELACDNTSNSSSISTPVQLDILSRKLDEAYYELDRAKSEGGVTQNKLVDKEKYVSELERKIEEYTLKNKALQEQIIKLQSYLGEMPTMEEHYSLKEQVTELHSKCISLTEALNEKDQERKKLTTQITENEETLSELNRQITELEQTRKELLQRVQGQDQRIVTLHSDNSQLKIDLQRHKQILSDVELKQRQDLRDMRERHRQRFLEATAKLKEQYRAMTKRNRLLELQLLKSSDMMTALNNELQISQGTVIDLKSSIGDLVSQNQALMEKHYGLQDKQLEGGSKGASPVSDYSDDGLLSQQLTQELSSCLEELDSLISLASSILEGRDPNVSVLLGVSGGNVQSRTSLTSLASGHDVEEEGVCRLEHQLSQVQRNRKEIERLREVMADHFANQVASQCHIQ